VAHKLKEKAKSREFLIKMISLQTITTATLKCVLRLIWSA